MDIYVGAFLVQDGKTAGEAPGALGAGDFTCPDVGSFTASLQLFAPDLSLHAGRVRVTFTVSSESDGSMLGHKTSQARIPDA